MYPRDCCRKRRLPGNRDDASDDHALRVSRDRFELVSWAARSPLATLLLARAPLGRMRGIETGAEKELPLAASRRSPYGPGHMSQLPEAERDLRELQAPSCRRGASALAPRNLADPTRRAVLERLGFGNATISELAEPFAMSLTGMKKHVRCSRRRSS
jgi:hypothetical protein